MIGFEWGLALYGKEHTIVRTGDMKSDTARAGICRTDQ